MAARDLESVTLLHERGHLSADNARTFVCRQVVVPEGARALRLRLEFDPPRSGRYNNLLTVTLFDRHGFRGAGHRHAPHQEILIGRRGATPGFVPGDVTAGEWTVELDCHCVLDPPTGGIEFALSVEAIAIEGGDAAWNVPVAAYLGAGRETLASPVEGRQSPASVPEYVAQRSERDKEPRRDEERRWRKGDLHIHTVHSDGHWSADDVVRYVEQYQLDFVATTDHNTTSAYEDVRWAIERAGLETVVIPAMELTTFWGHANALGVREWIDWRVRGPEGKPETIGDGADAPATPTMEAAARETQRRDGVFVVNHPRSPGYPSCTGCRWELGDATATYADAIEVWNGAWDRAHNLEALRIWDRWLDAGHRIPAVAGTDSHRWADRPERQGYTYVWASADERQILDAVRAGQSFVGCGPQLTWSLTHLGEPPKIEVAGLREPAEVRWLRNGREGGWVEVQGDGAVRGEFGLERGWCRAELWRRRGTMLLALVNPVWID